MLYLNRLLTRKKIVDFNDLTSDEEVEVFALLKPIQGEGDRATFLETVVDRVLEVVRLAAAGQRNKARTPDLPAAQHKDRPPPGIRRCVLGPEHHQKEDGEPMPAILDTPLMNTRDAARYLGISERQLQYEVAKGRITVVRLNRHLRFNERALHSYIERHTVAAKDTV